MIEHRHLERPDAVTVLVDGQQRSGWLTDWQRTDDGRWRGYVRYTAGDLGYVGWFPATEIAPVEAEPRL